MSDSLATAGSFAALAAAAAAAGAPAAAQASPPEAAPSPAGLPAAAPANAVPAAPEGDTSAAALAAALGRPAPAAGPVVVWLSAKPRETIVPLDWPLSVDGVAWTSIPCRRLTGAELDAFYDLPAEQREVLPTIMAPKAVLDLLDADDLIRVREAGLGFLPLDLRTAP